jgi:DNA repair protein RecO
MIMSRETTYTCIILKKQPLSEADELLTAYTKEQGKVRAVAKSSKLAKSKLQYQLQPMFLCQLAVTGSGSLAKVIRVQAENVFHNLHDNADQVQLWYVAAEFVMRATADEQPNAPLFEALLHFQKALDKEHVDNRASLLALVKFKIDALESIGLGVQAPPESAAAPFYFSNEVGGFMNGEKPSNGIHVHPKTMELFFQLKGIPFTDLARISVEAGELNGLLTQYITYQLEREIRSERFIPLGPV